MKAAETQDSLDASIQTVMKSIGKAEQATQKSRSTYEATVKDQVGYGATVWAASSGNAEAELFHVASKELANLRVELRGYKQRYKGLTGHEFGSL